MLVGAPRFELGTPSPPDWCANRAALRSDATRAGYSYGFSAPCARRSFRRQLGNRTLGTNIDVSGTVPYRTVPTAVITCNGIPSFLTCEGAMGTVSDLLGLAGAKSTPDAAPAIVPEHKSADQPPTATR